MYYVHKYEVWQEYGGSEEGGWWFERGEPVKNNWSPLEFRTEDAAFDCCRSLNLRERQRQEDECKYGYSSVLSYKDQFFAYDVSDLSYPVAYPERKPHYE